jgi:hypothetical protein
MHNVKNRMSKEIRMPKAEWPTKMAIELRAWVFVIHSKLVLRPSSFEGTSKCGVCVMRLVIIVAFVLVFASSTSAADWGHLKMRFVYDGEPPPPKTIIAGRAGAIPDESLLINGRDRGVKNVCVWLLYGGDDPLRHPDYEDCDQQSHDENRRRHIRPANRPRATNADARRLKRR